MPNPYVGNDDAARFIEYYASPRMQKDSVRRLYDDGMQRRRESQQRAEAKLYPTQPTTYRSQREIDEYVNEMVYAEVFRRQKRLAELEWELYQPTPTRLLGGKELEVHVHHMYDQQLRRRERREREWRRRLGILTDDDDDEEYYNYDKGRRSNSSSNHHQHHKKDMASERRRRILEEREMNRQREENWRPPSAYMKYDDGKFLLISELAAIHNERSLSPSPTPAFSNYNSTKNNNSNYNTPQRSQSRHADPKRLESLAKPLRVTPKVQKEEDTMMPPFRVLGNIPRSRNR